MKTDADRASTPTVVVRGDGGSWDRADDGHRIEGEDVYREGAIKDAMARSREKNAKILDELAKL